MKRVTRNEADFSDVFEFAKETLGHEWNRCCDLFHGSEFFSYQRYDDFELEELEAEEKEMTADPDDFDFLCDLGLARRIMIAYMKAKKVKTCRIYS
jgi:hypothetical protein